MCALRRASDVRKVELVDAALEVIAARGIAALSTRVLAEQVGLSSGAIFRHFASLEALLMAVVERVEEVLNATYPPPELPAIERLEGFIDARSSAVGSERGILRLLLSEQFLLALPKGGAERLSACVRQSRAFVIGCLREAQAAGEVRSDFPAEALAPIVLGTIQMLALSTGNSRHGAPAAQLVRAALLALLVPPARAPLRSRRRSRSP